MKLDKNAKQQPIILSKITLDNPFINTKNNNFPNVNYNKAQEEREIINKNFEENKNQKETAHSNFKNNNNFNYLTNTSLVNTNLVKNDLPIENFEERLDKLLSKDS